ncbi:hypothetical protein ROZALSC1DRAFT_14467 [Rozella allomycis CSF55]|uniref:Uncharacterized protein n=1 Tax=Rozella allomycis (strain CSF55) TaxID=988480 RepID=A0A4P9YJN7_ROZAC|nr:hypothetical protein ROZALSC1DRAFT_14467 [Rozella allomycis CSF55]
MPRFNSKDHYRKSTLQVDPNSYDVTPFSGIILLVFAFLFFAVSCYSILASKFLPDSGIKVLDCRYKLKWIDYIKYDQYYCLVLPMIIPVFLIFVFWNWLGIKLYTNIIRFKILST